MAAYLLWDHFERLWGPSLWHMPSHFYRWFCAAASSSRCLLTWLRRVGAPLRPSVRLVRPSSLLIPEAVPWYVSFPGPTVAPLHVALHRSLSADVLACWTR